ncbi:MAG: hypothetical protein II199_00045 [Bacteroidaceae bacterium]|nr:hypothetical protein [Bacteroidaceae bacterium]
MKKKKTIYENGILWLSFRLSYIKIGKDMIQLGVKVMSDIKYKRILLKVSGEALGEKTAAGDGFGLDFTKINAVCASIKECVDISEES